MCDVPRHRPWAVCWATAKKKCVTAFQVGAFIGCGTCDDAEHSRGRRCSFSERVPWRVLTLSPVVLQVKVEQMALELRLTPLTVLLRSVLDQLQEKDPARIFAQPVSLKEVGVHALLTGFALLLN